MKGVGRSEGKSIRDAMIHPQQVIDDIAGITLTVVDELLMHTRFCVI